MSDQIIFSGRYEELEEYLSFPRVDLISLDIITGILRRIRAATRKSL